jgi:putative zinc- or iron-chelating protein
MATRRLPLAPRFGPNDVFAAVHGTAVQALMEGPPLEAAINLARDAGHWADDAVARVVERVPRGRALACSEGCSFCCHLKVLVAPQEALALAAHLRARDDLDRVRGRVADTDARSRGMSHEERAHAKLPCPLLEDGRCVAYEARPLACRGAHSYDVDACRAAFDRPDVDSAIPFYKPQLQITEAVRAGLGAGAGYIRLDGRLLELVAALRIALEDESAAASWAAGGAPFAAAVDAELAAVLADHQRKPRQGS